MKMHLHRCNRKRMNAWPKAQLDLNMTQFWSLSHIDDIIQRYKPALAHTLQNNVLELWFTLLDIGFYKTSACVQYLAGSPGLHGFYCCCCCCCCIPAPTVSLRGWPLSLDLWAPISRISFFKVVAFLHWRSVPRSKACCSAWKRKTHKKTSRHSRVIPGLSQKDDYPYTSPHSRQIQV